MEVVGKVKHFVGKFETSYGAKVHGVMANNGTEFVNFNLQSDFKTHGITFYSSVPYIHKQNGVVEREIRMTMEGACAMLFASKLLKTLWSVAVKTIAYLHNRSLA